MKKTTKQLKYNFLLFFLLVSLASYGQSMATYTITFTGTWNATDHSEGGTAFPSNDHWSDLVGATHNSSITFWESGQLASTGIENIAETGNNAVFSNEVDTAIDSGNADQWLQKSVDPFDALGSATLTTVTVSEDFPLLTLVTMIAPSPDWFAGIHDVSLRNGGNWESSISIDLFPYDAGTEDGSTYSTSNSATASQQNIFSLTSVNPFNDQKVGTLTITLEEVLSTPANDFKSSINISPNPTTRIIYINNSTSETIKNIQVYDVIGKLVKTIPMQTSTLKTQIDLQGLNSGIYLIKLNSLKGSTSIKKLVIK